MLSFNSRKYRMINKVYVLYHLRFNGESREKEIKV